MSIDIFSGIIMAIILKVLAPLIILGLCLCALVLMVWLIAYVIERIRGY